MPTPNYANDKFPNYCVYTVLLGQYEELNEQPVSISSSIPFICLTDDPELTSETWQIRLVSPVFAMDEIRSQRDIKLRPHVYLPEFSASLYIDNSVLLKDIPENIIEQYGLESGICLPEHSFRNTVLNEFIEVAKLGFDDQTRIFEQLNHYLVDCPSVLEEKPYWTAILLRSHTDCRIQRMMEIWAGHVFRYSRRDQLSINLAFKLAGTAPNCMKIDNYDSWFHTWPITKRRERGKGMRCPTVSITPPLARIRQLEQKLIEQARTHQQEMMEKDEQQERAMDELAKKYQDDYLQVKEKMLSMEAISIQQNITVSELQTQVFALLNSTSWRITAPLRWLRQCFTQMSVLPQYTQNQVHKLLLHIPQYQLHTVAIALCERFQEAFGRQPQLNPPVSFNEHILYRILFDRDPRLKIICDKLAVRDYIRTQVGPEFLVPLLGVWKKPSEIDWDGLPDRFAFKPNHLSGPVIIIHNSADKQPEYLMDKATEWLDCDYYDISMEWGYRGIPRRLLAEPLLLGPDGGRATEVQVFTFAGKAKLIRVLTGEKLTDSRRDQWFDVTGNRLPFRSQIIPGEYVLTRSDVQILLLVAEKVSRTFSHLRVDFYLTDKGPLIGELTAYNQAGRQIFEPAEWDDKLGKLWECDFLAVEG